MTKKGEYHPLQRTRRPSYLPAGNKRRPDQDSDLWEAEITVRAEVEQRVHEVHLLGKRGRTEKS